MKDLFLRMVDEAIHSILLTGPNVKTLTLKNIHYEHISDTAPRSCTDDHR